MAGMQLDMPDWIVVPLVLLFGGMGTALLVYPERILATFAQALSRHRITAWLFFRNPATVRMTGLLYLGVAIALIWLRVPA